MQKTGRFKENSRTIVTTASSIATTESNVR